MLCHIVGDFYYLAGLFYLIQRLDRISDGPTHNIPTQGISECFEESEEAGFPSTPVSLLGANRIHGPPL
jgi:hypothetical protein